MLTPSIFPLPNENVFLSAYIRCVFRYVVRRLAVFNFHRKTNQNFHTQTCALGPSLYGLLQVPYHKITFFFCDHKIFCSNTHTPISHVHLSPLLLQKTQKNRTCVIDLAPSFLLNTKYRLVPIPYRAELFRVSGLL